MSAARDSFIRSLTAVGNPPFGYFSGRCLSLRKDWNRLTGGDHLPPDRRRSGSTPPEPDTERPPPTPVAGVARCPQPDPCFLGVRPQRATGRRPAIGRDAHGG